MSDKIQQWVGYLVEKENFKEYRIENEKIATNDQGYVSNLTFLTISGKTSEGRPKILEVVIKVALDTSADYRKNFPIEEIFGREIHIYTKVIPYFQKFSEDYGNIFRCIAPKCYYSQITKGKEGLILENLNSSGFYVYDRKKVMTLDHMELLLEYFAYWHGYSLALKNKNPGVFQELIKNNVNLSGVAFKIQNLLEDFYNVFQEIKKTITTPEILQKIHFTKDEIEYACTEVFFDDPEDHVILHGDCWTNNFLFKYHESKPIEVRFIDFQFGGVGSPILDISSLIFCCANLEDNYTIENLLGIYHDHLTKFLNSFCCDINQVFPYKKMMEHWKKYSSYGLFWSNFLLRFSLCEIEEAPNVAEELAKGRKLLDIINFPMKNKDNFLKRTRQNLLIYAKNAE